MDEGLDTGKAGRLGEAAPSGGVAGLGQRLKANGQLVRNRVSSTMKAGSKEV